MRTPLAAFFSILLDQSPLFQIILINDRGWFRREDAAFLKQSFHILADEVRLQIYLVADLLQSQRGDFGGMGNDRDDK